MFNVKVERIKEKEKEGDPTQNEFIQPLRTRHIKPYAYVQTS